MQETSKTRNLYNKKRALYYPLNEWRGCAKIITAKSWFKKKGETSLPYFRQARFQEWTAWLEYEHSRDLTGSKARSTGPCRDRRQDRDKNATGTNNATETPNPVEVPRDCRFTWIFSRTLWKISWKQPATGTYLPFEKIYSKTLTFPYLSRKEHEFGWFLMTVKNNGFFSYQERVTKPVISYVLPIRMMDGPVWCEDSCPLSSIWGGMMRMWWSYLKMKNWWNTDNSRTVDTIIWRSLEFRHFWS